VSDRAVTLHDGTWLCVQCTLMRVPLRPVSSRRVSAVGDMLRAAWWPAQATVAIFGGRRRGGPGPGLRRARATGGRKPSQTGPPAGLGCSARDSAHCDNRRPRRPATIM
jgi:hypothetical protein